MTVFAPWPALAGGTLIGLSAVLLMWGLGRTAGVSGILLRAMIERDGRDWRMAFVAGLPLGALLVTLAGLKDWSGFSFQAGGVTAVLAGLLVGTGTAIGSGCTSGHGVCGMARFSKRSIAATAVFMLAGAVTVFVARHVV